tara:strand:- start:192 stop:338 length:147 start_codon:yes stop_codon:yes gene_type:complete
MSQQSTQATAFVTPLTPNSRIQAVNEEKKRKEKEEIDYNSLEESLLKE